MSFSTKSSLIRSSLAGSCGCLLVLAMASCNGSRRSALPSDSVSSATSGDVTIQVQNIRRYESGIEVRLAIDNRSHQAVRFPRMQPTFTSLQVTGSGAPIAASRLERGQRVAFGTPYTIPSYSEGVLTVQFNRRDLDPTSRLTLQAAAQQGASNLTWTIELPGTK